MFFNLINTQYTTLFCIVSCVIIISLYRETIIPLLNNFLQLLLSLILRLLNLICKHINNYYSKLRSSLITLRSYSYDEQGRYQEYLIQNNNLLDSYTSLELIYNYLNINSKFKEFGIQKIIIYHAIVDGIEYSFHHNVAINSTTSFQEYWDKVKDIINTHYDEGCCSVI